MNLYDIEVQDAQGNPVKLSAYAGKTLLIVNTATECGFTPQYEGLQALYAKYRDQGLEILDFPCNQFGHQAPGSQAEIAEFCQMRFGTTFPQFAKIDVNGPDESPLYTWLKAQKGGLGGKDIKWNFTKFLVDENGQVLDRFAPTSTPKALEKKVADALGVPV